VYHKCTDRKTKNAPDEIKIKIWTKVIKKKKVRKINEKKKSTAHDANTIKKALSGKMALWENKEWTENLSS
jgi:hypothetical protein